MAACGLSFVPATGFLIQIRHGYAADSDGLRLSIESDREGWRAEVRDTNGRLLHSAHRCSGDSAKVAAAEFAVFGSGGVRGKSPEGLARQLSWTEYW